MSNFNPLVVAKDELRAGARAIALLSAAGRLAVLTRLATVLREDAADIINANKIDLDAADKRGISPSMRDRLALTPERIHQSADGVLAVAGLPDSLEEVIEEFTRPNGLIISKVRVPLGIVGIIYEGRPNVTIDAIALTVKTGNGVVLRGGSEAINSNLAIVASMHRAFSEAQLSLAGVFFLADTDRSGVDAMLTATGVIDVLIPRGSGQFIAHVRANAKVPIIETGAGNCHLYIAADADADMAIAIAIDGKTTRPSVCNALETILIDEAWSAEHILELLNSLKDNGVAIRGCSRTQDLASFVEAAVPEDYATEFLDYIIAVKIVASAKEAIDHINRYSTQHSEVIVTKDTELAARFAREVDSAVVYHNASTRFTDGSEFGFGAEIGISTQRLHACGPMGLKELTGYKYRIVGGGQVLG